MAELRQCWRQWTLTASGSDTWTLVSWKDSNRSTCEVDMTLRVGGWGRGCCRWMTVEEDFAQRTLSAEFWLARDHLQASNQTTSKTSISHNYSKLTDDWTSIQQNDKTAFIVNVFHVHLNSIYFSRREKLSIARCRHCNANSRQFL